MTDREEENRNMVPPRMHTEQRAGDSGRAVVINYSLAWTIFCTGVALVVLGAVWVTNIDNRVTQIEGRRVGRDQQFESIDTRINGLEIRIRPLEVTSASTANSLAFIRDQIMSGFTDLNRRLDQLSQDRP